MVTDTVNMIALDERIVQQLKDLNQKLEMDGKLPSPQQLVTYYTTFRNKFGPERLARLDGEALLETMHSHGTKDSLVYWLEFKDDEELPSLFGSISGGSAYKFGIFRKKETGAWTTGSHQKPVTLTVEEAILIARRNRDQFIKGAELLAALPAHGSIADYEQLQLGLERVAPDVNDTSWGHKYFSLLYPDKLDDFHNPDYARFHLIKLLQLPPQRTGRYLTAGYFVSIAHVLQMPINILATLLNERDGRDVHNYWRIGTAKYNDGKIKPKDQWPAMRDGNFCSVGWTIGDLSSITRDDDGKELLRAMLKSQYPDVLPAAIGKSLRQLFDFRWNIALGDLILASDGAAVLSVGRVTGGYQYKQNSEYPHHLPVEWLSLEEWQQPDQNPDIEGKLTSIYRMKRAINLIEAERHILNTVIQPPKPPLPGPVPLKPLTGIPGCIQAVLERKGQVILYGPPGTGKTYWARYTVLELAARSSFQTTFGALTLDQKLAVIGDEHSRVRICSFHPTYGYEDFLEGLRPETTSGQMHFVPRAGIFKRLCEDAATAPSEKFYLIIDEMNRGDVPRIFGELLTILEQDKRGIPLLLPLTQEQFQVPENVYIIGTMNTADRSIALLDTALRRRFGFIELLPDLAALKKAEVGGIPLGPWLEALNSRIREHVGSDARNLQIGHAYLMEKGQPIADFVTLAHVIQDDILPLLEEYCYEDYNKLAKIIGPGLVDINTQTIRHELFAIAQQATLVQALLAPSPEITTSAQAIAAEEQTQELLADEDGDESVDEQLTL